MRSSSKISENTRVRKAGTIRSGTHFWFGLWKFLLSITKFCKAFYCRWNGRKHHWLQMVSVLQMVQQGINRPGAMERAIDGLTKVLNERLRKLVNYGILQRYLP